MPGREKVEKAMLLSQAADYICQLQVLLVLIEMFKCTNLYNLFAICLHHTSSMLLQHHQGVLQAFRDDLSSWNSHSFHQVIPIATHKQDLLTILFCMIY